MLQMEVQADFLESLNSSLEAVEKVNSSVVYLNFENQDQLQRYYDALTDISYGFQALTEGFRLLVQSHGIDLIQSENN